MRSDRTNYRWLGVASWTLFGITMVLWLISIWVEFALHQGRTADCVLSCGELRLNEPAEYVCFNENHRSHSDEYHVYWLFDFERVENDWPFDMRLGLEFPVIDLGIENRHTVQMPLWCVAVAEVLFALRIRRERKVLMARQIRRRRRMSMAVGALCVVCLGGWYMTDRYYHAYFSIPYFHFECDYGNTVIRKCDLDWPHCLLERPSFAVFDQNHPRGGNRGSTPEPFYLNANYRDFDTDFLAVFPTWYASVAFALLAVYLWRSGNRARPNFCRNCDYDLTGNTSGKCSECGEPVPARLREQSSDNTRPASKNARSGGTPAR